jgi:type II secretory pathway pseudopilin PulG
MTLRGRLRRPDGYAMACLLTAMTIMAIVLSAALPAWKQIMQREKEEELVFRGEQYAHAIALFQRKFANSTPPNIDVLVQQRFLRKKYKDPITNDDFVPISIVPQTAAGAIQAGTQPGRGASASATPGAGTASPTTGATAGIIGVTSGSSDASIRTYNGRTHYNEWAFVSVALTQRAGAPTGGAAGAVGGGRGGRNAQPPNPPGGSFLDQLRRGAGRGNGRRGAPNPPSGGRGAGPAGGAFGVGDGIGRGSGR